MSSRFKIPSLFIFLECLLLLASGCSKSGALPASSSAAKISGNAMLGPVSGATVTAYSIGTTGALNTLTPLANTTTDSSGNYSLSIPAKVLPSGPVGIQLLGGTYTEESSGQTISLSGKSYTTMLPSVASSSTANAALGPLPDMAYQRFQSQMVSGLPSGTTLAQLVNNTNYQVSQAFGIPDVVATLPANTFGTIPNDATGQYALIMAGISKAAQTAGTDSTAIAAAYADHFVQNGNFTTVGTGSVSVTNATGDTVSFTPPSMTNLGTTCAQIGNGQIPLQGVTPPSDFTGPVFNSTPPAVAPPTYVSGKPIDNAPIPTPTVTSSPSPTPTPSPSLSPIGITPSTKTLMVGNSFAFSAGGGDGSYTYSVLTGGGGTFSGATYTAPNSAGIYTVGVTDSASNTSNATVTVNAALSISPASATMAVSDGLTFTVTGGVGGYTYSATAGTINGSTGAFTAPGSPASLTVTATDSLGNTSSSSVTVTNALAISPATKTLAVNNGFSFSATGGTAPYVYSVVTGGGGSFSGSTYTAPASTGTYTVKVTDALSATSTATVTINAALLISPTSKTLAVTNSFSFSATGGVSPHTYSVVTGGGGSFSGATYTAPNTSGTFTVRVTDSIGNTSDGTVTVNPALAIAPASKTVAVGNSATFSASGGVSPYSYMASNGTIGSGTGTYTAPNSAGSATITVTDSLGNNVNSTVTVNTALSASPSTKTLAVNNGFQVTASNGVPPYAYSASTGSITSGGLYTAPASSGSSSVTVTDSMSNTSTVNVTVNPALSISPASKTVAVNNSATFSATGGVSPYSYTKVSGNGAITTAGSYTAPASSGTDIVRVTDSLNNTSDATVTINPALAISPTTKTLAIGNAFAFSASGGAGSYTYSVVTGGGGSFSGSTYTAPNTSGTYTVKVTDGMANLSNAIVTVNPALAISPTTKTLVVGSSFAFSASGGVGSYTYSVVTAGGGSFSANSYTAPGTAGSYTVKVTDTFGNTSNATVTVNPVLAISPSTKTLAVGNVFTFTATGGISPYTFSANNGTINSGSGYYVAPGTPGSATVTATDSVGGTSNATVTINPALTITPTTASLIYGESQTFAGVNGVGSFSFSDSFFTINSATGALISQAASGTMTDIVTVTDSSGNTATASVTERALLQMDAYQLYSGSYCSLGAPNYCYNQANGIVVDSSNNIYVAGYGFKYSSATGTTLQHWIVRKSTNGGSTWSVIDDYQDCASNNSYATRIKIDSSGNIDVFGYVRDCSGSPAWIQRTSSDGGASWTSYTVANGNVTATDSSGDIYSITPSSRDPWNSSQYANAVVNPWVVQKSTDGGNTWSIVDSFSYASAHNSSAYSLAIDPSGGLYVVGWGEDSSNRLHWVVRKSSNGGSSWTTVDDFQKSAATNNAAYSIAIDLNGNVAVSGYGSQNWMIRRSRNGGTSWASIDPGPSISNGNTVANAIAVDASGRIYSAGYKNQLNWTSTWTTRILSP